MSTFVLESEQTDEPRVEVRLKRSSQAKRLSLRVSQLDGRVTLTLPRYASEAEATGFIREKAAWLRRHVARFDFYFLVLSIGHFTIASQIACGNK